jgi:hypothetical protein
LSREVDLLGRANLKKPTLINSNQSLFMDEVLKKLFEIAIDEIDSYYRSRKDF